MPVLLALLISIFTLPVALTVSAVSTSRSQPLRKSTLYLLSLLAWALLAVLVFYLRGSGFFPKF